MRIGRHHFAWAISAGIFLTVVLALHAVFAERDDWPFALAMLVFIWALGACCVPAAPSRKDTLRILQNTLYVLESSRNGVEWYRDMYPESRSSADDEHADMLDAAIEETAGFIQRIE